PQVWRLMTMDPWYYLTCPACRSRLRIKSEYTHMRGRCPACGLRIEPPIPKPLSMKAGDDTGGLVPEDEQWPEPATLLEESESGAEATYGVSAGAATVTKPKQEEEEQGGVYTLSFEANAPKSAGATRSAEWEQGSATAPDRAA